MFLQPYLGSWHCIYQDNYYITTVYPSEILLKTKTRVCGTIRENHVSTKQLKEKSKNLQRREMTFLQKGEVIVLIWKDKRLVCMVTTLHEASIASARTEDGRTGHHITKPTCILESNKHMKGLTQSIPGNLQYLLENLKMV